MLSQFVFVYIDNILIFSETREKHIQHVHLVPHCVLEYKLCIKVKVCEFQSTSTSIPGIVVQQGQLSPDPAKVSVVAERKP